MTDRDPVRNLALTIVGGESQELAASDAHWDDLCDEARDRVAEVERMIRALQSEQEAPLRARIAELEGKLATIVKWLEENQPDVFRRGLWDEISDPTAQALARLVEAATRFSRAYREHDLTPGAWGRFGDRMTDLVAAEGEYQAARSGRGEAE